MLTRNILLIATFFILTPVALGTSVFTLLAISLSNSQVIPTQKVFAQTTVKPQVFAATDTKQESIGVTINVADSRVDIVKQYLESYNSPLSEYAADIIHFADAYGIDFRMIPAIAQQESNLCKKIPEGSFNCWGWGIHSKGTLGFQSYTEAIEIVTRGLKTEYFDKGYSTPEEIMSKYTPSSPGTWANGVSLFMQEME